MDSVSIQVVDTPEKFHPAAEEAAQALTSLLRELAALGQEIGVAVRCQKEEIFDMMHRL